MKKKILAVIRTSTIRQEIQSQKKDLTEFCISKGFKEEEIIFVEGRGASARKKNDKYLQMLLDIKTTIEEYKLKNVACWHLNRLGRSEENLTALKEYFEQNYIQVYIKNPSLTLFNDDGTLNNGTSMAWTIFAMMIKFDTIELMDKLKRGREYNKEQKKYLGGKVLFGYRVNEYGYFEIDEKEADIVRFIFSQYSTGKYSTRKLVAELNERGYRNRNGNSFMPMVLNSMIRNEDYYNGEFYYPIITKEIFEICRKISVDNSVTISKERKIYLGSKILKCPSCGRSFSKLSSTNNASYYTCNGLKLKDCTAEIRQIKMEVFDYCLKQVAVNVYSKVAYTKQEEEREIWKVEIDDIQVRIDNLKEELGKTEKKIFRINRLYVNGAYENYNEYKKEYERIITDKKNYESRIKELKAKKNSLNKQIEIVNKGDSVFKWLEIRKEVLTIKDIKRIKEIIDLTVAYAYLKKFILNGKKYTAIIIVANDDINYKYLYLWNRRNLYGIIHYNLEIKCLKYNLDNSRPIETDMKISIEQFEELIAEPVDSKIKHD